MVSFTEKYPDRAYLSTGSESPFQREARLAYGSTGSQIQPIGYSGAGAVFSGPDSNPFTAVGGVGVATLEDVLGMNGNGNGNVSPAVSGSQLGAGLEVANALGIPSWLAAQLGIGSDLEFSNIIPGGAPFSVPNLPNNAKVVKSWNTGTTLGAMDEDRNVYMLKKDGTWKKVPKRKGFPIGKNPTSKNIARLSSAIRHFRTVDKNLECIRKTKVKRRQKRSC
jgi:hypothetical protein